VISSFSDLLLKATSPFVDHKLVNETFRFFKQGISIRILTEGEKYLMIFFYLISDEEQAIFHMIYILGSIFPRLIFSTIEQISLNYFQQTFSIIKTDRTIISNNQFIQDDQTAFTNNQKPLTPNGI
jgi:hypothetical protein